MFRAVTIALLGALALQTVFAQDGNSDDQSASVCDYKGVVPELLNDLLGDPKGSGSGVGGLLGGVGGAGSLVRRRRQEEEDGADGQDADDAAQGAQDQGQDIGVDLNADARAAPQQQGIKQGLLGGLLRRRRQLLSSTRGVVHSLGEVFGGNSIRRRRAAATAADSQSCPEKSDLAELLTDLFGGDIGNVGIDPKVLELLGLDGSESSTASSGANAPNAYPSGCVRRGEVIELLRSLLGPGVGNTSNTCVYRGVLLNIVTHLLGLNLNAILG